MSAVNTLDALYQQVILEHNRQPVGFNKIADADIIGEGHNPVCGDHIRIGVFLDAEHVQLHRLGFADESCAICTASASLLCKQLQQIPLNEVDEITNEFIGFIKQGDSTQNPLLEPMQVFAELQRLPARKRCATLPWETLLKTLQEQTRDHE